MSFSRKDEWSEVGEDCTILSRAIDLILETSENKVVTDEDLTQFVARIFAPGWMLVVFEHPEGELSIIASSIPNDCRIENFDPGQLYCDMFEGGIEALQDPMVR